MDIGTWLHTALFGKLVGRDAGGNRYYQARRGRGGMPARRWVMFNGPPEASAVWPEWHGWLHYTCDAPLSDDARRIWQKPHLPNLTGTPGSYRPPGHQYRGGQRRRSTGDYDAWTPDQVGR